MAKGDGAASRAKKIGPEGLALAGRVKAARLAAGLTQVQLAQRIGVAVRQIQKYELGINRVSLGRLDAIAGAVGADRLVLLDPSLDLTQEGAVLLRAFDRIADSDVRTSFVAMVEAAARANEP